MNRKKLLVISITINILFLVIGSLVLYKKGGVSYISNMFSVAMNKDKAADEHLPYYYDRKSLFERNQVNENSIVFLGDSLTDGNEWAEAFKNYNIINRGISSDTTSGILERLDSITNGKPNKVFIMVGTNDNGFGISIIKIANNYKKIIRTIKSESPSTKIYIQSCLPVNDVLNTSSRNTKGVIALNKKLQAIAEEEKTTFIDLFSPLSKEGQLDKQFTNDGIHLNANGYTVWETTIKRYVAQ